MEQKTIDWKLVMIAVAVAALICWLFIFGGKDKVVQITNNNQSAGGDADSKSEGNKTQQTNTQTNMQTQTNTHAVFGGWTWPMTKGTGTKANPSEEVKNLQEMANYYLQKDIAVDGQWGKNTEEAFERLRACTRLDKYGTPSTLQFRDYIETGSNGLYVSEDKYNRLVVNDNCLWNIDKARRGMPYPNENIA